MKRFLMFVLCFVFLVLVSGCEVDDEVRHDLFDTLQNEEIIDEDLDFIASYTSKTTGLFISSDTYYLYEDEDDNIIAINYFSCTGNTTCDSDYKISIYDVEVEDVELIEIDDEEVGYYDHYYIMKDKYYENMNYDLTLNDEYYATKHTKFLFFDYYKIDNED